MTEPAIPTVHPGSFCGPPGAAGQTSTKTPMACSSPDGKRARWRRSGPSPARLPRAAADTVRLPRTRGPRSVHHAGRDITDAVIAEFDGQQVDYEGRRRATRESPYDVHLARIAGMQNFNAKPQIGTRRRLDKAVAAGWTEVWRGVQDGKDRTAADINGDLREGHFQPGRGLYGNGCYTSARRMTAETFRGRDPVGNRPATGGDFTDADLEGDGDPDSLLRIAIDPRARVIDYNDLVAEQTEWVNGDGAALRDTAAGRLLADPGRYATARGYDVVRVVDRADGSFYPGWEESDDPDGLVPGMRQADQFIVLNRSVMMIQRVEDQP